MASIAPGLDGYIAAQQLRDQQAQSQLGALSQIMQMQQNQAMGPLHQALLQAQVDDYKRKALQAAQHEQSIGALSQVLAQPNYSANVPDAQAVESGTAGPEGDAMEQRALNQGAQQDRLAQLRSAFVKAAPDKAMTSLGNSLFPKDPNALTPNYRVTPDPNSPTKFSYVNLNNPGVMVAPAPPPSSMSDRPYFTTFATADGFQTFDNRSGVYRPAVGADGKPLIRPQDSPTVRASVARATEEGKAGGSNNMEQYKTAESSVETIAKSDQIIDTLKKGSAITGMGAEILRNVNRFKLLLGDDIKTKKRVVDSEVVDAMMGSDVFNMIRPLGIGARGLDTREEKEFLRKVLTGELSLNKDTLIQMATMRRDIAQRAIDRWNNRVEKGELDGFFQSTGMTKQKFNVGGRSAATQSSIPKVNAKGWKLFTDANGNRAYVGPNNEVEEAR